jgi:aminopeptidase YwaD
MNFHAIFLISLFLGSAGVTVPARAQNLVGARRVVQTLASPGYWGRGYLRGGMARAADFIAGELRASGVKPLSGNTYLQPFSYSINTFPGKVEATVNGMRLQAGVDFIVTADSSGRTAVAKLKADPGTAEKPTPDFYASADGNVRVRIVDKLTFAARQKERVQPWTEIQIDRKRWNGSVPETVSLDIETRLIDSFSASNLHAMVRGTVHPDEYVVMSAHYDHLGGLGSSAYFPGANDNASGVAFLLDLVRHYQQHPQPYTMVFLFFAGEEAGLVGSKYFVEHPLIPLKQIRFLTNFDMVGTGDDGAMAVNATIFKKQFSLLREVNNELKALPQIGERGEAKSSDHYWFYQAGVPCFFLYTMGGIQAYHDVFDRAETLPFTRYNKLFRLVTGFNDRIQTVQ